MIDRGVSAELNTYLATDSVDSVYRAAVDAGITTILAPFDVSEIGRMAFIVDPQGAYIALWQAGTTRVPSSLILLAPIPGQTCPFTTPRKR